KTRIFHNWLQNVLSPGSIASTCNNKRNKELYIRKHPKRRCYT
ncbi:hypothetical protein DOY81_000708, partial [Sarcophaga bullata]